MSDDRSFSGPASRARLDTADDEEVRAFARRHGLTPEEVRSMIERVGHERDALEREVQRTRRL